MIKENVKQQKVMMVYLLLFMSFNVLSAQTFSSQEKEQSIAQKNTAKNSAEVNFKARTDHDFLLSADYYYLGKKIDERKSPGVIILHDCASVRSRYSELAKAIAGQGIHVLSLDFRGYGGSVAKEFSQLEIKKHSKDIVSYQNEIALITSYWADDLWSAYQFLRIKVHKSKGIAVVASGCAASYAITLAERIQLSAMVFLTPEMSYRDKERYKNLIDTPNYFISSAHLLASYNTAQELFAWNGASRSKLQVFKGNRPDRKLISAKLNLLNDIAQWLKFNLR